MYFQGIGVPKNIEEGVKWWRRAAAQGNAEAAHNLAVVTRNKT
jgi:TPR repeat protein